VAPTHGQKLSTLPVSLVLDRDDILPKLRRILRIAGR